MGDVGVRKGDEAQPIETPSQTASNTSSVAAGLNQDAISRDRSRSRPSSRAPGSEQKADIPTRPDIREQIHPPARPRHGDGRLPPRPEGLDDRRDRLSDFGPRGRHGSGPDHGRSFDGSANNVRGRLNERLGDRDRDFPMRPPPDDLMRGPPRDTRAGRENGWPMDRPGRMRGPGPGPGPGPNDSFHGRDGPMRGELIPDHNDRPVDLPRRGDSSRSEKDDRRPYPQRPLSPARPADLPNRPDRFPPPDDRRPPVLTGSPRIDNLPRGPRSDRQNDIKNSAAGPDMNHGRLRPSDPPPSEAPLGPRRRGGRNTFGQAPPITSSANATTPLPDRQALAGPGRQNGRVAPEQPATPSQPVASAPGVHPDRLRNLVDDAPLSNPPSGPRGVSGPHQSPRGPVSSSGPPMGPGASPPSGPSGAGYGGERGRGDKRFAGLNNMLQQSGGGSERPGNPPSIRGRNATRQSNSMEGPSAESPNRPPTGPAGSQEDQPRSRPNGGRATDLIDDVLPEPARFGRTGDRNRDVEPNRENESERHDGSNMPRNRRDGRRNDRDRNRRSDIGAGGNRDDTERTGEPREALRRVQSSREELRRRDRRDRPDGPPEMTGPPNTGNPQENEARVRPSSSQGVPPPPPPPPMSERRFNAGGDRGPRSDNRDRERERRGDRRDRDHAGGGPGASGHRKRTRPGPDDNNPDGGGRGMRMGHDPKRPRRGA